MKKLSFLSFLFLITCSFTAFSQDAEGCKDPAMFPTRMPEYLVTECSANFDAVDFNLAPGGASMVTKEGSKTLVKYDFNSESGKPKPSALQILRNYEAASKKIGGVTRFLNAAEGLGVFAVMKGGKESAWVKVETGGNDNNDFYVLTMVELQSMKQEVTSEDILAALNADGHISLYINFETGKSVIQPESQTIIDQLAQMLAANSSLKVGVEGHTDNAGTVAGNKVLSENRAKSVVAALIAKGVDASRLSPRGWGQEKPIAENTSEEGRAKNRRVEIVKM